MIDKFLEFEEDHNLLVSTINNFHYWAYIRFEIYRNILRIENDRIPSQEKSRWEIRKKLQLLKNCTIHHPMLHAKQKDVLFIPHHRRMWDGKRYCCIYTDDLATELGDACVSAESYSKSGHMIPSSTK